MSHVRTALFLFVAVAAGAAFGAEGPVEDESLPRPLRDQPARYYAALAQVHATFRLWEQAEALLKKAVETEPNNVQKERLSFELVDQVYVPSKQWDKAADELVRTIGLVDEKNIALRRKYHLDRARMLSEAGPGRREEYVKELEAVAQASQTEEERSRALATLHAALKRLQKLEPKIAQYEDAVSRNPEDEVTLRILAEIYSESGLLDTPLPGKAIEKYEQLHKLQPDDLNTCEQLAKLYRRTDQRAKAVAMYERLLSLNPGRMESYVVEATSLLLAKGGEDETAAWCEKIEGLYPRRPEVPLRMGSIYTGWRKHAKAAECYARALALVQPDHEKAPIYLRLIEARIAAGDYAEAERNCRDALKLDLRGTQRDAVRKLLDQVVLLRAKTPEK